MSDRRCETCGHADADYDRADARHTVEKAAELWEHLTCAVDPALLDRPGDDGTTVTGLRLRSTAAVETADPESLHGLVHDLRLAGRLLHAMGAGAPNATGLVTGLHASAGGVPKAPVDAAAIGLRGMAGDRQRNRVHHGRPLQAISLWSADVVAALQAEGHPVRPGTAGENVLLAGLDWRAVRPGVRLQVGTALLEVSAYCTPCTKIRDSFAGGRFEVVHHERHPGRSRLYAAVLRDGFVRVGDPVLVEP